MRAIHDNPKTKPWMAAVAAAAREAYQGELLRGPLTVQILFYFPRPKGHFGSGRNAETVRKSAPYDHTTKPDLSKLVRAVEDACTKVLWHDDSQVIVLNAQKAYGPQAGCEVLVCPLSSPE